ncbi:hypothetical protein D5F01_LYC24591 [Larimichthys crocea]|uniref:Uncharacterized protein n=1 Tax=Larimichthys crocea TaxID=215358 RepID=A0A6G0HE29_LARCR|nr:hypothetical protein D5F01_LYC24591 [Larimichthys crocea]
MRLVPETVSITGERRGGSPSVKRAEFTVPSTLLREAEEALDDADDAHRCDSARLNRHSRVQYVPCPCCERSFKASEFWKHALLEIAEKGNRVPAWQSLDRSETPRWIVEESSGWSTPIYRPRGLEITEFNWTARNSGGTITIDDHSLGPCFLDPRSQLLCLHPDRTPTKEFLGVATEGVTGRDQWGRRENDEGEDDQRSNDDERDEPHEEHPEIAFGVKRKRKVCNVKEDNASNATGAPPSLRNLNH